tara:strand:- start:40 stop:348 length:309 start_codon:yes stop_codon:yes gene_type:complete
MLGFIQFILQEQTGDFSPRPPINDPKWPNMFPYPMDSGEDGVMGTEDDDPHGTKVWSDGTHIWIWHEGTDTWIKKELPTELKKKKREFQIPLPWEQKPTMYA